MTIKGVEINQIIMMYKQIIDLYTGIKKRGIKSCESR